MIGELIEIKWYFLLNITLGKNLQLLSFLIKSTSLQNHLQVVDTFGFNT